jgi:hypothetical protein
VATLADTCTALLSALPAGAIVGGVTAARLHGMWLPEAGAGERPEFILTRKGLRPHEFPGSRRREMRVRRRSVSGDDIVLVHGVPMTSAARSWLHLAERFDVNDLVAAGDSALRAGATTAELEEAVRSGRRCRGVVRARQALQLLDPRSRSRPESHLRCNLVLGGLPWPKVNRAIYTRHGEWLAEPDLHYEEAKLALEYNGADHAKPSQMRKDITRELDVDEHGWKVVVFGPAQVFGRPWRIAPYVAAMLDERDPGWRTRSGTR